MDNKERIMDVAKAFLLMIMGFVALITNVDTWNMAYMGYTDGFHVVVSILNFMMEGLGIYWFARKILYKKTS